MNKHNPSYLLPAIASHSPYNEFIVTSVCQLTTASQMISEIHFPLIKVTAQKVFFGIN